MSGTETHSAPLGTPGPGRIWSSERRMLLDPPHSPLLRPSCTGGVVVRARPRRAASRRQARWEIGQVTQYVHELARKRYAPHQYLS